MLIATSRKAVLPIEALSALAATGCAIFSAKADSKRKTDLHQVLTWASEELPRIEHIAHAAGVSEFRLLAELELSSFKDITAVKVSCSLRATMPAEMVITMEQRSSRS